MHSRLLRYGVCSVGGHAGRERAVLSCELLGQGALPPGLTGAVAAACQATVADRPIDIARPALGGGERASDPASPRAAGRIGRMRARAAPRVLTVRTIVPCATSARAGSSPGLVWVPRARAWRTGRVRSQWAMRRAACAGRF